MYYLVIKNNEIIDKTQVRYIAEGAINIEVTKEIYDEADRYIYDNGQIVLDPDYDEKQREKEYERIGDLTMTALDFITFLRQSGLSLEQIRTYLDNNIELDTQLKYCQNVYCRVARSVMPITVGGITITAEMVEEAFKVKNGENELLAEDDIPF